MTEETASTILRSWRTRVPPDLIRFGEVLERSDLLADGWAYYLTRPEKWAREFVIWRAAGEPAMIDAPAEAGS